MNKIRIKIDTQEKHLIDFIQNGCGEGGGEGGGEGSGSGDVGRLKKLVEYCSVKSLDIGDIHFYHLDRPDDPLVVIERKTIKDLASSIGDGRYKEQILRLKGLRNSSGGVPIRIIYLLEGCCFSGGKVVRRVRDLVGGSGGFYNGVTAEGVYSASINIMIRDNFHVVECRDKLETCLFLAKLLEQVEKKYSEIIGEMGVGGSGASLEKVAAHNYHYSSVIKSKKKDNVNPQVCYLDMLSRIPGVSTQTASYIVEKYPTMASLMEAYGVLGGDGDREKMLKDIEMKTSNGKIRRVGIKVSERVYRYLFGLDS